MFKKLSAVIAGLLLCGSAAAIMVDAEGGFITPLSPGLTAIGGAAVVNANNVNDKIEWFDDGGVVSDLTWTSLDPDIPIGGMGDIWKVEVNNRVITPAGGWTNLFAGRIEIEDGFQNFLFPVIYIESLNTAPCDPNPNPTGSPVPCDDSFPLLGDVPSTIPFMKDGENLNLELSLAGFVNSAIQDDRLYCAENNTCSFVVKGTVTRASVAEPTSALMLALGLGLVGLVGSRRDPKELRRNT